MLSPRILIVVGGIAAGARDGATPPRPQRRTKRAAFLLCELVHTQSQLGGDKAAGASSSESAQGRL